MSTSTPTCPICHQPLTQDVTGTASCSGCTASFRLLPIPSTATLSLPDATDPQATVDAGATVNVTPATPSEPRDDRAPAGYVIERELGRGGMGVVYLARQTRLNRPCALKMILAGGHAGEAERERFETEAQAIARLQHDNIVRVYEIGEHDGRPFMALEFCEGGSLDRKLRDQQPTAREAAALVRTLAHGMQAAHDAHVIHRDLKPANVLLAGDGTPKVTDFGLAKKLDEVGQTHTGSIMGTPSYMPPEQASGKKDLGPAVDVYALGAILYECLTGRPPFKAATPMETIFQVLENEPVPVRQLNPSIPLDLETIAHKCLQKEAGKRYPSAKDLADDLGRFLNGEAIRARPVGTIERAVKWVRRNPMVTTLSALVLLVLTAGVVVSWLLTGWALIEKTEANRQTGIALEKEAEATNHARRAVEKETEATKQAAIAKENAERAERENKLAQEQRDRAEHMVYAGKLSLAQSAFNEGNGALALQHLLKCQWNLCGWEYRHLLWQHDFSKRTLKLHTGVINCIMWSPDGSRFLTGSDDRTAKVWGAEKWQELLTLKGHTQRVSSVAWSPDGNRILTGSYDRTAKVWDAEKGQEILTLKEHTHNVLSVSWSPDGKRILTGSYDETARLWDAEKGSLIHTHKGHTSAIHSVAWSPNGRHFLTGSADRSAKVWDTEKGIEILALKGHMNPVTSVAFSPDGSRILSGCGSFFGFPTPGEAKVWDAEKGTLIHTLKGHGFGICSVAWSPDGNRILTGSADRTAKVWNAVSGTELLSLRGHAQWVKSMAISPDGSRILTAGGKPGYAGEVKVWDGVRGNEPLALTGHTDSVRSVSWSPDGKRILTGSWDNTARVWDAEKGQKLFTFKGARGPLSWSPDGTRILTASLDTTAKVWDAEKGQELLTLSGHTSYVLSVSWSPDGTRILTGSGDQSKLSLPGEAKVWDAEKGQEVLTLKGHTSYVLSVSWSSDGERILTGSYDKTAKVWDAQKGQEVLSLKGHTDRVTSVAFSPDGKRILTESGDRTAKVWDAQKGTLIHTFKGYTMGMFNPDGNLVVTTGGNFDFAAKVWDATRGTNLLFLEGHTQGVSSVSWSPNGKRILTGSDDKTAKVWDAETGAELLTLKGAGGPVSWSPDGKRILTGSNDRTAKVWDAVEGIEVRIIWRDMDHRVDRVAWDGDGKRLFGWDNLGEIRAWDVATGQQVNPSHPPGKPSVYRPATHPNKRLEARVGENDNIMIVDLLHPIGKPWLLPDPAERMRYHSDQAAEAEKQEQHFAASFHCGQLLRLHPEDADLHIRQMHLLAEQGRGEEATRHLMQALFLRPQVALWVLDPKASARGESAAQSGDWKRAIREFQRATGQPNSTASSLFGFLQAQKAAGDAIGARETASHALQRYRRLPEETNWVGIVAEVPLERAEAEKLPDLSAELLKRQRNANTLHVHGIALFRAGRYEEADRTLVESVKEQGKGGFVDTWLYQAIVARKLGRANEAAALLKRVEAWVAKQTFPKWQDRVKWEARLKEAREVVNAFVPMPDPVP